MCDTGEGSFFKARPFVARYSESCCKVLRFIAEIFAPVSTSARMEKPAIEVRRVGREGECCRVEIELIYSALTENPAGEDEASWTQARTGPLMVRGFRPCAAGRFGVR